MYGRVLYRFTEFLNTNFFYFLDFSDVGTRSLNSFNRFIKGVQFILFCHRGKRIKTFSIGVISKTMFALIL